MNLLTNPRKPAFDGVLIVPGISKDLWNNPGNIHAFNNMLDAWGAERELVSIGSKNEPCNQLTMPILLELLEHEGLVLEAYKDSVGVWTWGGGVTDKSGHLVMRYKDKPASIEHCLKIYEWLLRVKYLPDVLKAFGDFPLSETQLGGALSFHWNTGAILTADWVKKVKAGDHDGAYAAMLNWSKPKEIIPRRKLERALFFEGRWSSDGVVNIYTRVRKPSYAPDWSSAKPTDIRAELQKLLP